MKDRKAVQEWLDYAEMDLKSAEFLKSMHPVPIEIICYHCHQTAEKSLKALLIANGVKLEKTHDLMKLADELNQYILIDDSLYDSIEFLIPFDSRIRYPANRDLIETDALESTEKAKKIYSFTVEWLKADNSSEIGGREI